MKISDMYIKTFGFYRNFSFKPKEKGLHLIYGPNESGKTTLLMSMRAALFGLNTKEKKDSELILSMERSNKSYRLERAGKKTIFAEEGERPLLIEPRELWWHGLDRKTYERIFALTLEDLQGNAFLNDVEVRTRFFGIDGGERLSETVKDIEKTSTELLVASANGKRKINVLMERMNQNRAWLASLENGERAYLNLRHQLEGTEVTENELQGRLQQWRDYVGSIELVLRSWDTYKRAQEAKSKMASLGGDAALEGEAFLALDEEIRQCQEHMRIWRGKEEGLLPENFSPESPLAIYSQDVENLYQQLSNWEALRKDCAEGESYIQKVRENLQLARRIQSSWRADRPLPETVDWAAGEKLAQRVRSTKDAEKQWKLRVPVRPADITEEDEVGLNEAELDQIGQKVEKMKGAYLKKEALEQELLEKFVQPPRTQVWTILSLILAVAAVLLYFSSRQQSDFGWMIAFALLLLAGGSCYAYGLISQSRYEEQKTELQKNVSEVEKELKLLDGELHWGIPANADDLLALTTQYENLRKAFYSRDVDLARLHAYLQEKTRWEEEGKRLLEERERAEIAWKAWLPEGANQTLSEDDLFGLRQEFERYSDQLAQLKNYEKQLEEHKSKLGAIEEQARMLWENLALEGTPSIGALKRLYSTLTVYRQNMVRWEQKESQRKNFREEFDQWHRKEKDLLLRQQELVQKSGLASAAEFRQRLLSQGQYRQWEIIYKQSKEQLNLLAPRKEVYDLLCRRLQEGNKEKWLDEQTHGTEEITSLEQQLADLYKWRGELTESLRNLSQNRDREKALQEKSQLEAEFSKSLEDWLTQVFVGHFIEEAQLIYEKEKQPQVVSLADAYLQKLTKGIYSLEINFESNELYARKEGGERLTVEQWSSGLGDQIYLALRLSLARCFGSQVEPLPLILDDILLRFDEERQREALYLLADLCEEEQIFVFTCQEGMLRLAKEMKEPRINLYRLDKEQLVEL